MTKSFPFVEDKQIMIYIKIYVSKRVMIIAIQLGTPSKLATAWSSLKVGETTLWFQNQHREWKNAWNIVKYLQIPIYIYMYRTQLFYMSLHCVYSKTSSHILYVWNIFCDMAMLATSKKMQRRYNWYQFTTILVGVYTLQSDIGSCHNKNI